MNAVPAAELVAKLRERLVSIQRRAVYAMRAAAARGAQPSPKTIEVMAHAIEIQEYAESISLLLAGTEEDAANQADEKQLVSISEELDRVGAALSKHMNPKLEVTRLDRSSP